jgi:hypothetical protein
MSFTVIECEQRTPEWVAARLGLLTSSCAAEMLATISKGEAAGRRNLRVRLVLERITGRCHERGGMTQAMQDGVDREADALALYEVLTGNLVSRAGFARLDGVMAGMSPDGVVGDWEGLVEAKSPIPATHLEYIRTGMVPGEYMKQIIHGLWVTGALWCDWLSYNPDFPERLQSKVVRVERANVDITGYEKKAKAFLAEVDAEVNSISTLANLGAAFGTAADEVFARR